MTYEVAKTFERDGKRFRPGNDLPEGLDKVALAHYERYGMVREARTSAPSEKKPVFPDRKTAKPKRATPGEQPVPQETKTSAEQSTTAGGGTTAAQESGTQGADGASAPVAGDAGSGTEGGAAAAGSSAE